MLLLSLLKYDSRNFKINIDCHKVHEKIMRAGYIISPQPLCDVSAVRAPVCTRE